MYIIGSTQNSVDAEGSSKHQGSLIITTVLIRLTLVFMKEMPLTIMNNVKALSLVVCTLSLPSPLSFRVPSKDSSQAATKIHSSYKNPKVMTSYVFLGWSIHIPKAVM